MKITDEAVEAAARASYPAWRHKAEQAGVEPPVSFDDLPAVVKASFFNDVRPALKAAAPFIIWEE